MNVRQFVDRIAALDVKDALCNAAWRLSWEKFEAMSAQYPKLALDLTKGLAAVLAVRMREAILVGQFV
jgi:hypothetical protein